MSVVSRSICMCPPFVCGVCAALNVDLTSP